MPASSLPLLDQDLSACCAPIMKMVRFPRWIIAAGFDGNGEGWTAISPST